MFVTVNSIRKCENYPISENISDVIFRELKFPAQTRFSYAVMNKRHLGPPVIYSNYPAEWIRKYIDMTLYKYDPVILMARKSIMPFLWDDKTLSFNTSVYNKIFEVSREYNIYSGYAFPLHDHENNLATLSLYTEGECGVLLKQYVEEHKRSIQLLLLSVHEQYMHIEPHLDKLPRGKSERTLTVRQVEVLRWASLGKTYGEIAIIMGITESTVKFHISNLIVKLGVVNAKHAIRKASDLHLFDANE
ncbi:LuxR family transcriptional regulator [Acerihabitans arboris]|uniref:LuxR family transcriptional regulator n=1 Tax=Acerihabitans arboris TaxID=2691583 RepID=A0A845SI93_9GAMM|nr:LuxR family transcriptional regulator [Acerihabitans arboris]NDL63649.1 LuxR family transcriptional regulator [Acerihabitans arboris]